MSRSGFGSEFFPGLNGGVLDLESPFDIHQHSCMTYHSLKPPHQINMMSGIDNDRMPTGSMEIKGSNQVLGLGRGKAVSLSDVGNDNDLTDEDEPSLNEDGTGENTDMVKGKRGCPWQRMKWTDNVVRLLIAVVACVGDDGTLDCGDGLKRKSGVLHKKGKWKTVSKIMISKGCHVSPQQCEDKFNDLNKRYKKLNDILGRGTSCRVVENPALMDSMPHLSAKSKDDVRKILSSKHLFYKEICAYHNGQRIPNCQDLDLQGYSLHLGSSSKDNESDEEEQEENDETDDNESKHEDNNNVHADPERPAACGVRKRMPEDDGYFLPTPVAHDQFEFEMARIFQDPAVSMRDRQEWIHKHNLLLQEQRVSNQAESLELEKQRFKWLRYCSKKDREMEKLRLENERKRLENDQKILQLRQHELEIDLKRSEITTVPSSYGMPRLPGRDHTGLDRHL